MGMRPLRLVRATASVAAAASRRWASPVYGFTKEDIASAFASKRQVSPHSELLTLSHPGGATVRVALGFEHPRDAPTIAQFHPVPG